ncbi:MAG: hypothetical protein QM656_14690 [Paracoccaceae bacterium]
MAHARWWGGSPHGAAFNIDQPVGQGQPNRPGDVALVQWMVRHLHYLSPVATGGWRSLRFDVPGAQAPQITGQFDADTALWIAAYQHWRSDNAVPEDPAPQEIAMLAGRRVEIRPWSYPVPLDFAVQVVDAGVTMALMNFDLRPTPRAELIRDLPQALAREICFQ